MSLINVSNLTFAYDGSYDNIFENVSFQLDTDWRLGFTGRNGRGKTTFLNLLMGNYAYSGTITSSVEFEYFPYKIDDPDEEVFSLIRELCGAPDWKIVRETALLEVDEGVLYRPFSTLSNGERTKALLAALFLRENSFLLIDEPTNHLDTAAREAVARYLKKKNGFILVSHDRVFLDSVVDHILSINRADIEVQKGNFSSWLENKRLRDEFEIESNNKLKKEIGRLATASARASDWSSKAEGRKIGIDPRKVEKSTSRRAMEGAKSKKLNARAKAIEARCDKAIEEKSGLMKNLEKSDKLKLSPLEYHTACLADFADLSVGYNGVTVCEGIKFSVMRGDRIALCGKNGCGKSTILKLLCGENEKIEHSGTFTLGSRLIVSYVPQSTDGLLGSLDDYADSYGIDVSLFKAILRKLDLQRVQFEKQLEAFSEGQKKKVMLARSLCEKAHLYVWDEPLNFIDVISRMQIEELLKEYSPTMIFVEHDKAFCDNISTKKVLL